MVRERFIRVPKDEKAMEDSDLRTVIMNIIEYIPW